jgi:hypothetical protein
MTDAPDCELTRHLQAAHKALQKAWFEKDFRFVEDADEIIDAALGLFAHAYIARNNTGKGMLVVPLAEESGV